MEYTSELGSVQSASLLCELSSWSYDLSISNEPSRSHTNYRYIGGYEQRRDG